MLRAIKLQHDQTSPNLVQVPSKLNISRDAAAEIGKQFRALDNSVIIWVISITLPNSDLCIARPVKDELVSLTNHASLISHHFFVTLFP